MNIMEETLTLTEASKILKCVVKYVFSKKRDRIIAEVLDRVKEVDSIKKGKGVYVNITMCEGEKISKKLVFMEFIQNGLGINKRTVDKINPFTVTHLNSGLAVFRFRNLKTAKNFIKLCVERGFDFSKDDDKGTFITSIASDLWNIKNELEKYK